MPSITKRKDGRWMVRYTIRGRRIYRYFQSREAARICADTVEEMLRQGAEPSGLTVSRWVHECMETFGAYLSIDTRKAYTSIIRHHIDGEELGQIRLEDLRPLDLHRWVNGMAALSPKTVRNVAGVMNWALVKAVQNRLLTANPLAGVALPRRTKPKRNPWRHPPSLRCDPSARCPKRSIAAVAADLPESASFPAPSAFFS